MKLKVTVSKGTGSDKAENYDETVEVVVKQQGAAKTEFTGTFTFTSSLGKYEHETSYHYEDDFFKASSLGYNHNLATMSMCLNLAANSKVETGKTNPYANSSKNIENLLWDIGFIQFRTNNSYNRKPTTESIGIAMANKKIYSNDGEYTLLSVIIRGGGYEEEWANNFQFGSLYGNSSSLFPYSKYHQGFGKAAQETLEFIKNYIEETFISKNIKVWITGYGRGGAIANLVAGALDDNKYNLGNVVLRDRDLYAYCFNAPAGAKLNSDESGNGLIPNRKYYNIYNIINQNDMVPMLSNHLGYSLYGWKCYIPTAETLSKGYNELVEKVNQNYENLHKKMGYFDSGPYDVGIITEVVFSDLQFLGMDKIFDDNHPITSENTKTLDIPQDAYLESIVEYLVKEYYKSTDIYVFNYESQLVSAFKTFGGNYNSIFSEPFINIIFLNEPWHTLFKDIGIYSYFGLGYNNTMHTLQSNRGKILQASFPEYCLAWLRSLDGRLEEYTGGKYRKLLFNCPLNIEVFDKSNNLVAKIVGDIPQNISGSSIISILDANGQKIIYLPTNEEYIVKLTATDNGYMSYSIHEFDSNLGMFTHIVNYYDIAISKGDKLNGIVKNLTEENNANYILVGSDNEKIEPSEVFNNINEIENYEVNVEAIGNGFVTGEGARIKGEFAMLTAYPAEGEQFLGWYKDGEEISSEISYRFCVLSNITIQAKFTTITVIKGDLNGDGKVDINDAQFYLEYLVGNKTLTPTQESALGDIVNKSDSAIKQLRAFLNFLKTQ